MRKPNRNTEILLMNKRRKKSALRLKSLRKKIYNQDKYISKLESLLEKQKEAIKDLLNNNKKETSVDDPQT